MSLYPYYQTHLRHLYMYLLERVKYDLKAINAERVVNNLKPIELNEEQLSEVVTSLINYLHDTEEFAEVIRSEIELFAKVEQ